MSRASGTTHVPELPGAQQMRMQRVLVNIDTIPDDKTDVERAINTEMEFQVVMAAIESLGRPHSVVVKSLFLEELSRKKAAAVCGCKKRKFDKLQEEALEALRHKLRPILS